MINTESQYLKFAESPSPSGKTSIVTVVSRRSNNMLGAIHWLPAWRCYVFGPAHDTLFNNECLEDVRRVITELMERRK